VAIYRSRGYGLGLVQDVMGQWWERSEDCQWNDLRLVDRRVWGMEWECEVAIEGLLQVLQITKSCLTF
jgi:hypothetical protein